MMGGRGFARGESCYVGSSWWNITHTVLLSLFYQYVYKQIKVIQFDVLIVTSGKEVVHGLARSANPRRWLRLKSILKFWNNCLCLLICEHGLSILRRGEPSPQRWIRTIQIMLEYYYVPLCLWRWYINQEDSSAQHVATLVSFKLLLLLLLLK